MKARQSQSSRDLDRVLEIDLVVTGSNARSPYLRTIAQRGGLSVVELQGEVQAFSCLDHSYFFEKPFISLLIVHPDVQRKGLGRHLLQFNEHKGFAELWTSTNRSNVAMQGLLARAGWQACGEISGLDAGDPELIFKKDP